jgi:hypothetical protein
MMGNSFGADDERTISRVENAQYDQNVAGMQQMDGAGLMSNGPSMMPSVMNGSCKLFDLFR